MLSPLGFDVDSAADGTAAIEAVRAKAPDLVLMDLRMEPMSGVEAVRRLRADTSLRGLKIVAFSASTIGFTREQALEIGCDDLLSKPFREADLFALLERQLRIRWRRAQSAPDRTTGASSVLPTTEQAEAVFEAARRGDATAVREELGRLADGDPALREWTRDIEGLAAQFRMQEIRRRLAALTE
jgi:CheY-like chemotaxis protein